jgi:hypothetical protein
LSHGSQYITFVKHTRDTNVGTSMFFIITL